MEKIWDKKFEKKDMQFPSDIAVEYCNQLYDMTDKLVIAKVEKYDKSIEEMNFTLPILNINPLVKISKVEEHLGEVSGDDKFTYELYLTGKNTPKYKYRFCFIENGIYPYPVKIAMDTDIAKELEYETKISCENEETYKEILIKILKSNKMKEVIEGLMTINYEMNKN